MRYALPRLLGTSGTAVPPMINMPVLELKDIFALVIFKGSLVEPPKFKFYSGSVYKSSSTFVTYGISSCFKIPYLGCF